MNLELLLAKPPELHGPEGAKTDGWRLDDAALRFLDSHVTRGMRTIETGAGVSTIVFALKQSRHTCVVPDRRVVRRIRRYCASRGVSLQTVSFVIDRSEYVLPRLPLIPYDFALIDGRHGFPAPFIDWFYIADRLRNGGVVLIDDTWIWTCDVLMRFLEANAGWSRWAALPNSVAFLKERCDAHHAEWVNQPFVYQQSAAAEFYPRAITETVRDVCGGRHGDAGPTRMG
jgi:Methyltransferase domain